MKTITFFLCTLFLFSGCSSPKHLSSPKDLKYHVKGLYAQVNIYGTFKHIHGEIIAANANEITVLPFDSKDNITTIAKDNIQTINVLISLTVNNPKKINTWASLVNLTSIGHGFYGIFTLPINMSVTAGITNSKYSMKYPDNISWDKLSKFARFPQGIPKQIDLNSIH